MSNKPTEESFLKDVADHKIEILLDNDVYRHVRFAQPGTNCYSFNLITGPGFLLYRGDMGCFEFERLHDMFEFFRSGEVGQEIKINLGYWSEKLEAVDKDGGYQKFSTEAFESHVKEILIRYMRDRDLSRSDRKELRNQVETELLCGHDNAFEGFRMAADFNFIDSNNKQHYLFQDFWECDCDEYTYHFVWCCYAISWGIQQYDQHKSLTG
jgi:hypothetical protein